MYVTWLDALLFTTFPVVMAVGQLDPKPFRWTATADSILGKVAAICNELR